MSHEIFARAAAHEPFGAQGEQPEAGREQDEFEQERGIGGHGADFSSGGPRHGSGKN